MTLEDIKDLHPGAIVINAETGFNPVIEAFRFVDDADSPREIEGLIITDTKDAFFIDAQTLNHCVVDPGEADEWLMSQGFIYDGNYFRPLIMPAHEFAAKVNEIGMKAAVDSLNTACFDYWCTDFADAWNALEAYRYTLIAPCVQAAMIRYTLD